MSDEELQFSFRQLIVKIADGLNDKNCQNLDYLYELRMPKEDLQGLKILVELEKRDHLNYKEPERLIKILSDLNRKDLVKLVTGYRDGPLKSSGIKRSGRKGSKHKAAAENDTPLKSPTSGSIIPATLMTILLINGNTFKLLEQVQQDESGIPRKNEAALADVKSHYKKFSDALKKCIQDFHESQPQPNLHVLQVEEKTPEVTKKRPIPPPKPKKEFYSSESSSDFPTCSTSPSEDDTKLKPIQYRLEKKTEHGSGTLESCTGDSGFGEDTWEKTGLPTTTKSHVPVVSQESSKKGDSDGPIYDDPWPTQETDNYEGLSIDNLEQPSEYTNIP